MKTHLIRNIAATCLLLSQAGASSAQGMTDAQKAEIGTVVREYLIQNPEVLVEAMSALEAKRMAEEAKAQSAALASVAGETIATPAGTALGNPDGDVTLVEFFDYNCGFCKRALPDMEALIASDPKLRVVLKEIPVLGEESVQASRASLAFRYLQPNRYGEFQRKLLAHPGVADEDSAIGVAEELGVSEADLRKAMTLPDVMATIEENNRLSGILKINGTPTYVVANEVIAGAVGQAALAERIADVRRCGKATC